MEEDDERVVPIGGDVDAVGDGIEGAHLDGSGGGAEDFGFGVVAGMGGSGGCGCR